MNQYSKDTVTEILIETLGWHKEEAKEAVEQGNAYLIEESDLYEEIAEFLGMDNWSRQAQMYFDWDKYIRDMRYNGEVYNLNTWPKNKYIRIR